MKIHAFFLRLCVVSSICLAIASAAVLETNVPSAEAAAAVQAPAPTPVEVIVPGLDELREQLRTLQQSNQEMQRSNEEMQRSSAQASQKWDAIAQQNAALSNVLSSLQQTLVSQKERELELGKQSNALNLKVIAGAAVAVFLVFLFSYWFQLRCMNRVMELSRSIPALQTHEPALLEQENPATSKLLAAMKLLEKRLQHLEMPESAGLNGHGATAEGAASQAPTLLNSGMQESVSPSSSSVLLAKGQIFLDTERLQEALACFQEALAVDPTNAEAHLRKGIALERMNRLELALSSYEDALRLNPKRAIANVYRARVLAALHRYDEAISSYDSALGRSAGKQQTPIFVS
jgi:tetratricopeptide (TPR) repeat protein